MFAGQIGRILAVDRSRQARGGVLAVVVPFAVAILNLFLCASIETGVRTDSRGYFISLFLFMQATMIVALNISFFVRNTAPLLARIRIFPVSPLERYVASVAIELRRYTFLAILVSTCVFFLILYRSAPATPIAPTGVYLLFVASIQFSTSTIAILVVRTRYPAASALAIAGCALTAASVGVLSFGLDHLVQGVPLVRWATMGILASTEGQASGVAGASALLAGTACLAALIGGRYA
jgi:hypothetical protein